MSSSRAIMKRYGFRYRHLREDPNTGLHTVTIRCFNGSRKKVVIELAPSILSQKNQLLARLRDIDAVLPDNVSELEKLLQAIATVGPDKRERYAKSNGWSDDGTYFVIGKYIIGEAPEGQLGVRKAPGSSGEPGQLRSKGTASDWKNTVGKHALASSTAMLAVCAALAAPLLKFMGQTSFGYCFCAETRSGKSLASWIGASLVGIKSMEEFLTWYSSTTSVEERLPEYCDMMATIDDISTMRARRGLSFSVQLISPMSWAPTRAGVDRASIRSRPAPRTSGIER